MTLSASIYFFIRVIFLLLAALALRDLWRYRDKARVGIVFMFAALGIVVLAGQIPATNETMRRIIQSAVVLALVSHPYLLLRLVHSFRPVPRLVRWAVATGLLLSWLLVILAVAGPSLPPSLTLLLIAYFVVFELYAAVALFHSARLTRGVSRWRLSLISIGSAMLAAAILSLRLRMALPLDADAGELLFSLLAMIAAITYYLGFATPLWLRRSWQLNELYRFLSQSAGRSINQNLYEELASVAHAAKRAVGAYATAVLLGEKSERSLKITVAEDLPALQTLTLLEDGAAPRAWYLQQPQIAPEPAHFGLLEGEALVAATGAHALYAVPIATANHPPGILLLFLRNTPLFTEDDLAMLALFAEQSAITLDNITLLAEQKALVDKLVENEAHLEELVIERTAKLSITNEQLLQEAAERRRVAEELHQLNEELEQRVHARTKLLEKTNRELESFAYSVSHDLRAPLRAIDGFSQALLEDYVERLDKEGKHYLERVRANAQRMAELIEDLLKLSRMAREEMHDEQVNLSDMAQAIMADLRARDTARQLDVIIEPNLVAQGDMRLLRAVLWNLLENAWKFTGKREQAMIEFGMEECEGGNAYFVRDNGAGFDMTYADKLFGAFQRLHRADEFTGIGIGLATVQRIIHRHNGNVWAQSVPDGGATFYFTLGAPEQPFEE